MLRAQILLEQYSLRTISFEEDALNAIVGALNTLSAEDIYHIWGIPFSHTTYEQDSETKLPSPISGELALLWHHESSCNRRAPFPSWSSVGWDGKISWRDPETTRIKTNSIVLHIGGTVSPLSSLSPDYLRSPLEIPRCIEILTEAADARSVEKIWIRSTNTNLRGPELGSRLVRGIALSLGPGLRVMARPYWNTFPTNFERGIRLKAILIRKDDEEAAGQRAVHDCVLLLKRSNDHYERVGIFWMSLKEPDHGLRTRDFDVTFVNDNGLMVGTPYRQMYELYGKDWEHRMWWRQVFQPELVCLG